MISSKTWPTKLFLTWVWVSLLTRSANFAPITTQDPKPTAQDFHNISSHKYPVNGTFPAPHNSSSPHNSYPSSPPPTASNQSSPANTSVVPSNVNPTPSANPNGTATASSATQDQTASSPASTGNSTEKDQGLSPNSKKGSGKSTQEDIHGLKPEALMGIIVGSTFGGVLAILGVLFGYTRWVHPRWQKAKGKQPALPPSG